MTHKDKVYSLRFDLIDFLIQIFLNFFQFFRVRQQVEDPDGNEISLPSHKGRAGLPFLGRLSRAADSCGGCTVM